MQLHVLNSNSLGNCYILESTDSALIIECGVPFKYVQKALSFNIDKIVGAVLSHEHGDHAGRAREYARNAVKIYTHPAVAEKFKLRKIKGVEKTTFSIGDYTIRPFDIVHDVPGYGFLIKHPDMGTLCFITDSMYINAKFPDVTHFLMEVNHVDEILEKRIAEGKLNGHLYNRVKESHMSLETALRFLSAQDLSSTHTIICAHLSDTNSDANLIRNKILSATGKRVYVADKGANMYIGKEPF